MISRLAFPEYVLHDLSSPSAVCVQTIEGLSDTSWRVNQYDKAGEDGGQVATLLLGSRLVSISGEIKGADAATFEAARQALARGTAPVRDSIGRPAPQKISITTRSGAGFFVRGVIRKQNIEIKYNSFATFLIEMVCPDPQVFEDSTTSSGQVTRPTSTGAAFPWVFDPTIEFGSTTGGVAVVNNTGSADVWPIITLRGALTNPAILHEESGTLMQLNTTLGFNDIVVIDMKQHSIVLNGTTNYLAFKTTDSDWFSILTGTNILRFNTGSTADTGTMEVAFNVGHLAI